ncbi:transposase [Apibacter sp. B2912]|uniref:terminase small subunit-like protein n=1 Tax=Apibacter sp. B2912 TaxID=2656763 RepID=UPI001368D641|nr:transposase [Apibacter sp. B2912]MXO31804.1 hypothetical protein [Apibacter sp. B2912]
MAKYSKEIVEEITDLIKSDSYTVTEICKRVGIADCTYFEWQKEKPDFSEKIKKAKKERRKMYAVEAEKSLLKKIRGYEVVETKTVNRQKSTEITTTTKHILPDTAAIIFALTNQDPENWKNKQYNEHTGKDGDDLFKSFDASKIPTENLKKVEKILSEGQNNS